MNNNTVWFTSDLHFGHINILDFCNRPFKDVEEMDAALIANWNSVVGPHDPIYIIGDLSIGHKPKVVAEIISQLNGQKFLIAGNHDSKLRKNPAVKEQFIWIKDYHAIRHEGQYITMMHYPLLTWNRQTHGSWMLHGHSHGGLSHEHHIYPGRLDVGSDPMLFYPVNFDEVKALMNDKRERFNGDLFK